MKNKILSLSLLILMVLGLASCSTSRNRYGCPSVHKAPVNGTVVEKANI